MAVKFAKSASTWGICNNNDNDPDLCAESGQTLQGSFSAVSKPIFASKYALQALAEIYTMHFANFANFAYPNP